MRRKANIIGIKIKTQIKIHFNKVKSQVETLDQTQCINHQVLLVTEDVSITAIKFPDILNSMIF